MTTKEKIHAQMTIDEILGGFPSKAQKIAHELTSAGLHCVGCGAATWETLEAGMLSHGMTMEQVEVMVNKLNAVLEEKQDLSTITITPKAASKYMEILAEEKKEGWGMRFTERMAGCSGWEYILDFSEKANPTDTVFECQGIEVHIETEMVPRLIGSTIDYVEGLQNAGFKISNPNVRAACGCGSSHGY